MRALLRLLLLAAAARAPFWEVALRTPLDGDTAIVGLMARHPLPGATLWGQPYGSPLDAWVAAPFEAALGPSAAALRLPSFLLALALVGAVHALGEALRPGAGRPAALLVALPPAYLLLLSALPPPLYLTTLVLLAAVLALGLSAAGAWGAGRAPSAGRLAALGALSGLAIWTHLMSLATVAAVVGGLAGSARRGPRRLRSLLWVALPLLAASAPWWTRAARDPAATAVLGVAYEGRGALEHAASVAARLHEPVAGLLGAWTPVTADEAERTARAPAVVGLLIAAGWGVLAAAGLADVRSRPGGLMLAASAALTLAAFPFPVRSEPHTLRFLTPALAPLAALAGAGALRLAGRARAGLVVLPLCAAQLVTGALLLGAWRRLGAEALAPGCAPALRVLDGHGLTRAYASYNTAWCLTYSSGERVIASQPWNERFHGHPLPFLDEVRSAPRVAWVLMPGLDFDLPPPEVFESRLRALGGRFARVENGPAVVYLGFLPPFAAEAAPAVVPGPAGDGDVDTRVQEPPAGAALFRLSRPLAARGLTLLAGPEPPGLPRSMNVEVSSDGLVFERVGRRRRGRETVEMAWLNGHPQLALDDLAWSVPLDGRVVAAVRIVPVERRPWALAELLLHEHTPESPSPAAEARETRGEPPAGPADASRLFRRLLAAHAVRPHPR